MGFARFPSRTSERDRNLPPLQSARSCACPHPRFRRARRNFRHSLSRVRRDLPRKGRELHHMHVLVEPRVIRVHIDDHHCAPATFAHEVVHQDLRELRVAERHESQAALDVACVELGAGAHALLQRSSEGALVHAEGLHALPEDHERLVDVARLAKALARGVGVLCALGPRKINQCKARCLDACRILSLGELSAPTREGEDVHSARRGEHAEP